MKIAFVTDDEQTISAHFGRATKYLIVTLDEGKEVEREVREKPHHSPGAHHGHGHDAPIMPGERHSHEHHHGGRMTHEHEHGAHDHTSMIAPLAGVDVLVARGMGRPAFNALREDGLEVVMTDVASIDEAVQAYAAGTLENRAERIH